MLKNSRSVAHALHTTRDDDVLVSGLDALSRKDDGLETTGADFVDRRRVRAGLHASTEGDLPGW